MKKIHFLLYISLISFVSFAQDGVEDNHTITIGLPASSVLDIEGPGGDKSLTFTTQAVVEAGSEYNYDLVDETLWLNYSNVKAENGATRKVNVQMAGALPEGMTLTVSADPYSGNGEGEVGTPNPMAIVLDGSISTIVSNIGSVYTGNGINNGHNLSYELEFDNARLEYLSANLNTAVTITYTIEDE